MEKDDIHLSDIKRILIGNAPPEFLLEVFLRTLVFYILVLVVIKFFGKRLSAQVTLTEMAVIIMLGAIIGSPIQIPDRGILTAFIILCSTLLLQRLANTWSFSKPGFETLTQGSSALLVKDGVLQIEQLKKERVSTQQLFATLRESEIAHLGEVKRVYLEACGSFTVYKNATAVAGLSVFPPRDKKILRNRPTYHNLKACTVCGTVVEIDRAECPNCNSQQFTTAMR